MKRTNPQILRYQKNNLSFWLCMLAIAADVFHFVLLYESRVIAPDINMGVDIIINIFFLLVVFLASEKSKAHILSWSYTLFALSAIQILRIFYLPLMYYVSGKLSVNGFAFSITLLIISSVSLGVAALINLLRSKSLKNYLKDTEKLPKG